jgi:hypothetical protein
MKTVLVVVGNYAEFVNQACDMLKAGKGGKFNKRKGVLVVDDVEYINVPYPINFRGFHGYEVEWWGTALQRNDYLDMVLAAKQEKLG